VAVAGEIGATARDVEDLQPAFERQAAIEAHDLVSA